MKFDLQLFGSKGGSITQYTPSDEQRELWKLQIESVKERQPNEKYMNEQGRKFMEEIVGQLSEAYTNHTHEHNFVSMGDIAINRVNQSYQMLSNVVDWNDDNQVKPKTLGRNSLAADELHDRLWGLQSDTTYLYVTRNYDDFEDYRDDLKDFTKNNNQEVGNLATETRTDVATINREIDNYAGKYKTAATTANTSTNVAQGKNDSLVSGLNTSLSSYNTLQSGKANTAESLLGGLNTSNNSAVNQATTILQPLVAQTQNAAFVANGNLDNNKLRGGVALTATNSILGGYGNTLRSATNDYISDTDDRIDLNDDNADEIYKYSKNAANDATNTASNNNADLTEYIKTNKGGLSDSKADLANLKNGVLPKNYLQNMEDAIKRAMQNTIGATINTLGNRGVLNSSVTTRAFNDIEKNAADQLAQKYLENIQTIERLSNDQFDHVITTDHENAEMTRQKNDIAQDALDRAFKYRQTGYEDLAKNSAQNAELELRELTAKQNEVTQGAGLTQQAHSNSFNENQFEAQLTQNQFGNTQTGIQEAAALAQNMYGNTTNANQLNASNINSGYSVQSNAINSNWGRTQAGFEAGRQNNLQAIQNAQTHFENTDKAYNSEVSLQNNLLENDLKGITTRASLCGQQANQYDTMISNLANMTNSRLNAALSSSRLFGDWYNVAYQGEMQAIKADTDVYQSAIRQAGMPLQLAGAAHEAAIYLPTAMWNASIGLNAPTLGAMNGLSGTGSTTVSNGGDNFWSGLGAGFMGTGMKYVVGAMG